MHTSTIEPSSSLLAFIRQSGRPKGPSSAMKLVEVILLALSSDIHAQLFACGLEYGAEYCGQQPCGQPYPGVGVGLPPPSPPMPEPVPHAMRSGAPAIRSSQLYLLGQQWHISGRGLSLPSTAATTTAAPRATTKVSPGMHPASDTRDMATPGRDREDGDYGDGQYAQPGHYQGDMDDDWSIRTGRAARALERGVQTRGTMGTAGAAIAPDTTIRATA
ncbi:hypothetical protein KXV22_008522 [Aspergillus fumigatus]|uniref:Uncharacterized protein n=1 Tax=Aspergillus fumigatus TaxID=746128 RepID=A0A8H4IDF1_ASPFM|nr:hypothetical protein CNMCM8057_006222 [Aspergillus fumigatus]KAF4294210.1 hypothetical protein CNMCM8686_004158 [Aspergillus fumigatus]KAH1277485.1 hypothetical protein KXX30_004281 [Aspergillus fumigatus]KAH1371216.1 hypothetical protein KXX14_007289 [Aspergillus fumigatus]KAH1374559.1 hypothetical protein KXX50_001809 [Aspergillus fumigatus]